ncbi:MAG: TlyA family RNA methyltransferase [Candidatus Aminicenantales bacterium]
MGKDRADRILVTRGLAASRQKAQALIMAGLVFAGERRIDKAGMLVDEESDIFLKEKLPYVSRGGLKLEEALDRFEISVEGKTTADLGSSTGGFTDCLLQRGARRVYAVDVDIRQLDWKLRQDSRVICLEKNARYLDKEDFSHTLDLVTMDLSFISIIKVLPAIKRFLGNGFLLSLVKPQFEAGPRQVGKKGIVRDAGLHEEVLVKVIAAAQAMGFALRKLMKCSLPGARGNREFFALWSLGERSLTSGEEMRLVKEAVRDGKN